MVCCCFFFFFLEKEMNAMKLMNFNLKQQFSHGDLKLISATFYNVQIRNEHEDSWSSSMITSMYIFNANGTDDFQALQKLCVRGPYSF